jgi:putative transposase
VKLCFLSPGLTCRLRGKPRALGISRGSVYYLPKPVSVIDLAIMRSMDELHLHYPFAGSRMLSTFCARKAS